MRITKKLFSVFLAVLMAMSCCVAAFPTIAEAALNYNSGASQAAYIENLIKILQSIPENERSAYTIVSTVSDFTATDKPETITRTIVDNSTNGAFYDAAKYILLLANEVRTFTVDEGWDNRKPDANHYALRKAVLSALNNLGSQSWVVQFVNDVLHVGEGVRDYYYYDSTREPSRKDRTTMGKDDDKYYGLPVSYETVVSRTRDQAMMSFGYDKLYSDSGDTGVVDASIGTVLNIHIPIQRSWSHEWGNVFNGKRKYIYLHFQQGQDFTVTESNNQDTYVADLADYQKYYTNDLIGADLSKLSYAELSERFAKNNDYISRNVTGKYSSAVIDKYITNPTKAQIDAYVQNVALWVDRAYIREKNEEIQAQMASLPLDPEPTNSDALRQSSGKVQGFMTELTNKGIVKGHQAWDWAEENTNFNGDAINKYISDALYLAAKIDILAYKAVIDPVIARHPDQEAVNTMTDEELYQDHAAVLSAWNTIQSIAKASGQSSQRAFREIYPDGGTDVMLWLSLVAQRIVDRGLIDEEDELTLPELFPYPYIADVDFSTMPSKNIYEDHLTKEDSWNALVEKYGEERLTNWFAKQKPDIDGYGATVMQAIKDYFKNAEAELLKRINEDFDHIRALAPDDKVGIGNYKDIITAYESGTEWDIYNSYLKDKSSLTAKKAKADTLYNQAKAFRNNIWTTDPNAWVSRQIDWPKRPAAGIDLGRAASPVNETYFTSEKKTQATLDVLDEFLLSNDLGGLLRMTDKEGNELANLSEILNNLLGDNLYQDRIITKIVNMLYPMLDNMLENSTENLKVAGISVSGTVRDNLYDGLENGKIYLYPTKVAGYLERKDSQQYAQVITYLRTVNGKREEDRWGYVGHPGQWADGSDPNLPLGLPEDISWGVENAPAGQKRQAFINALSDALGSLGPILIALMTSTGADNVKMFLNIGEGKIAAVDAYEKAFLPIFEALGMADYMPTSAEMRSHTNIDTAGRDIIGSLLNGIFDWMDKKLMKQPVETILNMLPGLIYTLNRGYLKTWINSLVLDINADIRVLGIKLTSVDIVTLNVWDLLADNLLGAHQLDSLSDILALVEEKAGLTGIGSILGATEQDKIDTEALIASCGILKNGLPSKTAAGTRQGVEPNGAKMLYTFLNFIFTHVDPILNLVSGLTSSGGGEAKPLIPEILNPILDNMKTNPDGVFTALIELFQPYTKEGTADTGYEPIPYKWWGWQEPSSDSSLPTQGASAYIYLKYGNDWSYEKAKTLYDKLEEIVNLILSNVTTKGGYQNVGEFLNAVIGEMFSNSSVTGLVKILTQLGSLVSNETVTFLLSRVGSGMDLGIWARAYGGFFSEDGSVQNQNEPKLSRLTAVKSEDGSLVWSFDGKALEKGNKQLFIGMLAYLLNELSPVVNLFLSGEDLKLFDGTLSLVGYSGYDSAFIPLLEALGMKKEDGLLTQAEFDAANPSGAAKINALLNLIFDYVEKALTMEKPISNLIANILPSLLYFIQSNGISTVLLNLLHPITNLWDTVSPIASGLEIDTGAALGVLKIKDLNSLLSGILTNLVQKIFPDAEIKSLDLKNLSMHSIASLATEITGLNTKPLVYGIDAISSVDRAEYDSMSATVGKGWTFSDSGDNTHDPANVLTVILSLALDLVMTKGNAEILDELLKDTLGNRAGLLATVRDALRGVGIDPSSLRSIDWYYFDESFAPDYESEYGSADFVGKVATPPRTNFYIRYANDMEFTENMWTQELANFLDSSLASIVDLVISNVEVGGKKHATLGEFLQALLEDNRVFTDQTINKIAAALRDLIAQLNDNNNGIVASVSDLVSVFFGADLNWWNEEKYPVIADADAKPLSNEEFAKALAGLFEPLDDTHEGASGILSYLLTGKDYKFLYTSEEGADPEDLLIFKGGVGYDSAIVPLLEALGCKMPAIGRDESGKITDTGIDVLEKTVLALLNRKDELLKAPLDEFLGAIPNVIYFLNANGISTALLNLLNPVIQVANAVLPKIMPDDANKDDIVAFLNEFVKEALKLDKNSGFNIAKIDLETILDLVKSLTGINVKDAVTLTFAQPGEEAYQYNYLTNFYIGELERYKSANGSYAYRMGFGAYDSENPQDREARADFLTILIYTVFDVLNFEGNLDAIKALIKDENVSKTLDGVVALLHTTVSEYEGMDWFYFAKDKEAAKNQASIDGEYVINPDDTTMHYLKDTYLKENDWNHETALLFKSIFYDLVDTILKQVDPSLEGGVDAYVKEIWNSLWTEQGSEALGIKLNGELLTNLNKQIIDLLKGLNNGQPLFGETTVLDILSALGIKIDENYKNDTPYYADYKAFTKDLLELLKPYKKLLDWLLVGEDKALAFFFTADNQDAISIGGGNGYDSALIPLLEALGCKAEPAKDGLDAIEKTVNSLFDLIEGIVNNEDGALQALVTKIPNLLYYINANGLSVLARNLLAPVSVVLTAASDVAGQDLSIESLLSGVLPENVKLDLNNLDLTAVLTLAEGLLVKEDGTALHILDAVKDPVSGDNYLEDFAIGKVVKYDSASEAHGNLGFRMENNTETDGVDIFTVLLCSVLDILDYDENAAYLTAAFGEDIYNIILAVFDLKNAEAKYIDYDWDYFSNLFAQETEKLANGESWKIENTNDYIRYANDLNPNNLWSEKLALFLDKSLGNIVDMVIASVTKGKANESATLNEFLSKSFKLEDLYTKANIQKIVDALKNVVPAEIADFEGVLHVFLKVDLSAWNNYQFLTDKETYTQEEFAAELANVLKPLSRVLDWLLLGKEYAFFMSVDGTDQIVINGGNGYLKAIAPLLEALFIDVPKPTPETTSEQLIEDVVNAALAKVNSLLTDGSALDNILALLPNLFYFINANGISVTAVNLLAPVAALAEKVLPLLPSLGVKLPFEVPMNEDGSLDVIGLLDNIIASMVNLEEAGIKELSVGKLNLAGILNIVKDITGINIHDAVTMPNRNNFNYLDNFYIGKLNKYESADGTSKFRMTFNEDCEYRADRADLITILLYTVIDVFKFEGNKQPLCDLFFKGETASYDAILDLMNTTVAEYEEFDWFYFAPEEQHAEIARQITNEGKYVVGLEGTTMDYLLNTYLRYDEGNIWNEQTAKLFEENFTKIVDLIVSLIDKDAGSASAYLKSLWDGANLYTEKNVYAVGAAIYNALENVISTELMTGLTVGDLLEQLDVNIKSLKKYTGTPSDKVYKTKEEFANALIEVFEPLGLVLDWLLTGQSISIFFTADDKDAISIGGGKGYANALVPILEALGCRPEALAENAKGTDALRNFLLAVLGLVEDVVNSEDAVDKVIDLLPNLIYFINSKGLARSVLNLVKPVDAVLSKVATIANDESLVSVEALLNKLLDLGQYGIKDLRNLDLNAVCDIVSALVEGLYIKEAISVEEDGVVKNYLEDFAIGEVIPYDSISDFKAAYRMQYSEDPAAISRVDLFTILVCTVLDLFKYPGNKEFIVNKLFGGGEEGEKSYNAVMALLDSTIDPVYREYDWFYFDKGINAGSFEKDGDKVDVSYDKSTMGYLHYNNLWNENTKAYVERNFYDIVNLIISSTTDYDTLESFIKTEWSGLNLYNKKNVYKIGKLVGEAITGLDDTLQTVIGVVLGIPDGVWDQYINADIDSIDEPMSRQDFIAAILDIFKPAKNILDWLLVGEEKSLDIFYSKNGGAGISISGANGFLKGIVPLAEAFGIRFTKEEIDAVSADSIAAIALVADKLLALVDSIGAEENPTTVKDIVALIPNLVYFINANGLSVSVNNLILPLVNVLDAVGKIANDENLSDLGKLFGLDKYGVDLNNLDIVSIFGIVKNAFGIEINKAVTYQGVNLYEYLAIGQVEKFTSANGDPAYAMTYSDSEDTLDGVDMLTILVSSILNVFTLEENETKLKELLGENIFNVITKVLSLKLDQDKYPYLQFRWLYTTNNYTEIDEKYKDLVFSPMYGSTPNFDYSYDQYWTEEKANYVNSHLPEFVDHLMHLLGIQINGMTLDNLGDLLNQLIGENLYTPDLMNKLANALANLVDKINSVAPAGSNIRLSDAINAVLNTDINVYYEYREHPFDFEVGDKEAFVDAFVTLLRPLYPVLRVVLAGEDLALFSGHEGEDLIVVPGGKGYSEGIIPLLEALDRKLPIKTYDEYVADVAKNEDNLVLDIINPILSFLDYVLEDPLNRIVDILPGVIYYINSKGLDSSFKNALHPVYMVLTAIEPLVKVDLYEAMGFNLEEMTFETLYGMLIRKLSDKLGAVLTPLIGSAVEELSLGKVVKYHSKSGHVAFTMEYASQKEFASESEMITILLRLVLKWLVMEENRDTVRELIREYTGDNADYLIALYDTFAEYASMPHGVNMIMGLLYYVFYGVDKGVGSADEWLGGVNSKWKFVMDLLGGAESDYLKNYGDTLKKFIDKYTNGVIDSEGFASQGLIPFFKKIINWIKSIINMIKSLFNGSKS